MSASSAIRCAAALFNQRFTVGDGQSMRLDAKTALRSPQRPLCAHPLSCPIAAIAAAHCAAELMRVASVTSTTNGLNSNPHSATPALPACQTARGFLPQGFEAYPTPTAGPAHLPLSAEVIDAGAILDRHSSAVGVG